MPGTLLVDDWQKAVEDQLHNVAREAQSKLQVLQDIPRPGADPTQVMQSLQSTAQQAFGGLQVLGGDVQQSAQDVNASLQQTAQQTLGGLVPLQSAQPPVVPPQPAAPVAVTAGAQPSMAPEGAPSIAAAPVRLGQGQQDFVASLQPLAARVAARSGIDPNVMIAIAANETGWGQSRTAREQNNLFSIQGPSGRASRWVTYASPEESFDAFVDLISTAPRYRQAWAVRNDPDRFVDALRQAGYVADEPGYPAQGWVDQVKRINAGLPQAPQAGFGERIGGLVEQGRRMVTTGGAALPHAEEPASATDNLGDKWKTQFGFKATYTGSYRTGTPHRGIDLVPQRGGIGTPIEAFQPGTVSLIQRDSGGAGGLMVYVQDADGLTHAYMHLQKTRDGLKVGDTINRGDYIANMGESGTEGSPHLHYEVRRGLSGDPLDQLIDPRPYMAGVRTPGGTTDQRAAGYQAPGEPTRMGVTALGDQTPPAARPPLYVGQDQGPLQVLEDTRSRVGGFFEDVGRGARQVQQDVEPARRWIAGESQAEARAQGYSPEFQAQAAQIKRAYDERPPLELTPGTVAGGAWNMLIQNPANTGIQLDEYMQIEGQKNKWLEDNNPLKVITPTVPVVEGLTTMVAQQLTSPLVVATFPATVGLGMRAGAAVTEAALSRGAAQWVANVAGRLTAGGISNGLQNAIFEATQPGATPEAVGMAVLLGAGLGGGLDVAVPGARAAVRRIGREISDAVRDQQTRDVLQAFARSEVGELNLEGTGGARQAGEELRTARAVTPPAQEAVPAAPPSVAAVPPPIEPRVAPVSRPPSGVGRPFNYQPETPEFRFNEAARASAASSPDGLAHLDLNALGPTILPFDPVGGGTRRIKTMPGGLPSLDNLRALAETSLRQRDFYADQADDASRLVGPNVDEWLSVNSMTSAQTPLRDQMAEAIQTMGTVREVAARALREGKDVETEIVRVLRSKDEFPLVSYTHPQKREFMIEGYTTGNSPVKGAPKTPSFAGNYDSALKRQYDPRITNDTWDWQIMNVSDDLSPTFGAERIAREQAAFMGPEGPRAKALAKAGALPATTPKEIARRDKAILAASERAYKPPMQRRHFNNAANDDTAYRGVEAVFNELAAERGMDGYQMQSLLWSAIRHLFSDNELQALWKAGQFDRAIRLGEERGVFAQKLGGEIDEALNDPKVQAALQRWGHLLQTPAPLRGQGMRRSYAGETQSKPAARPARPSSAEFRAEERAFMEAGAPVVRGLDEPTVERLGLDREKGFFPWLTASHRVTEAQPGEYVVHLPAGNEDTARYVAGVVGQAGDFDNVPLNVPDARVTDRAGVKFSGTTAEVDALKGALDNIGVAAVRGSEGRSLQVPFERVNDQAVEDAVQDAALSVGIDDSRLGVYSGEADYVQRSDYAAATEGGAAAFGPTSPGRRDLLERGVGGLPPSPPAAGLTAPGGAEPPRGGLRRARGESELPFTLNLGGAALGGYAGYAATPEDSEWSEYARNIGLGATAGLLGTRAITGGGGRRLARAAAGFRAPGGAPEPRADLFEARTTGRGGEPGDLGEVHSNRWLLNEAGPDETPMTVDERVEYLDTIEARLEEVKSRAAAVDEVLRNPIRKPYRPSWAAGYTNDALIEIARRNGVSAYEEAWDQKIGFDPGSGEVKYDVGESGLRGTGRREPTPTELRAELNALRQEEKDLLASGEQLVSAPDDARLVRRPTAAQGDLPWNDAGTQENAPNGPYATEVSGPSGNLAEDIVSRNGTARPRSPLEGLWQEPGQVVGRGEVKGRTVTGRGITDPTQAAEVSARAAKRMPNLDAMLGDEMPEVRAQIEQAVNDNIELFEAYQQGRISHDSLVHDLATKVGMSKKDFLATPVGKGFSTAETVALQAAAISSQLDQRALAEAIEARDGVGALSPEEVAYGLSSLLDAARLTSVAAGARSTAGRTLNALKIRIDAAMGKAISASNELISARRVRDQAKRGEARAKKLLEQAKETDAERAQVAQAAKAATDAGHPSARGKGNIWQQIDDAYNDLDRYQAMTLHEKAADFDKLARERAERAAARKARVREAPEELLSALKAELAAERKIFAGRKNTWESMAFWDSKADEIAAQKRADFRGGLYLEQQRKAANEALKKAEQDAERAWKAESGRQTRQTERATMLLERIGGIEPTRELLDQFVKAINSGDDLAAAKFLKGMQDPGWWGKATILRLAGLLSSTATHMANTVGNLSQPIIEIPSHAITVGIDWARVAKNGGERQAYWAELGPMLEAYGPGVLASWNDAVRVLKTGITPTDLTDLSRIRAGFRSGSERVDMAVEMPLRLLSASDVLFRGGAFAMHANRVATRFAVGEGFEGAARRGRAADIVAHLEEFPELYQEAYDAAARMVFQERRSTPLAPGFARGAPGAIQRGAVSQVLPFIKTPANITAQGFGLTPLGFLGVGEAIANRPNVPAARMGRQTLLAEERAARATVGTLILGGFMALGAGTLTGGKSMLTAGYPQDPGEASTLPPGWREWSLRVEDGVTGNVHYVPFQNFGAAGVPMAMAALLTDSGKRGRGLLDKDELTRAATGVGGYVLDNTFLQGLSDTVNVLHSPERYAPRFVEGLIASYGPFSAMGRQMQRAYGVAARNPREGFQGMVDALISSYPGVSGLVPEATTALGEPRSMGVSGIGAYASPVRSSLEVDEPTLRILRENDVNIAPPSKSISIGKGQEIELTEVEQDQLKRARGAAIRRNVAAAQQSEGWRRATDVTARNAILRHAMQAAQESSKLEFFKTLSTAEVEQRRKAARELEPTYIGGAP